MEAERVLPPSIHLLMMAGGGGGRWMDGKGAIYYSELQKHSQGTLQTGNCTQKDKKKNISSWNFKHHTKQSWEELELKCVH